MNRWAILRSSLRDSSLHLHIALLTIFMHSPLIIGHRGASAVAPENTLAAFARALDDGADGLEFDVRLARDGIPVCIHDATLKRTGLLNAKIATLSSNDLGEVDVGTWFNRRFPKRARPEYSRERVPTLDQVLRSTGQRSRRLYVEMKCETGEAHALASAVAGLVRAHALIDRVVVESFALDAIRELKLIAPEIRAAALFERKLSRPLPSAHALVAQALECGADEVALQRSLVRPRIVEAARRARLDVLVWTADHPSWIRRAIDAGLCAVITNKPAQMRAALEEATRAGKM